MPTHSGIKRKQLGCLRALLTNDKVTVINRKVPRVKTPHLWTGEAHDLDNSGVAGQEIPNGSES